MGVALVGNRVTKLVNGKRIALGAEEATELKALRDQWAIDDAARKADQTAKDQIKTAALADGAGSVTREEWVRLVTYLRSVL